MKELELYGLSDWKGAGKTIFRANGCEKCNGTGYLGRTGIFEIFEINPAIGQAIADKASTDTLEEMAKANGMVTIREMGLEKVLQGTTSLAEIARVTL